MEVISEICCDLSCLAVPHHIYAKQDDKDSRFVKVKFTYDGEIMDLSNVSRSEIRVQKPDGALTVNEGQTPADGEIIFPLTQQSLAAPGEAMVDFVIYDGDDTVISAVPASMTVVAAAVGDESIVSTDEYTAFQEDYSEFKATYNKFISQTYSGQMTKFGNTLSEIQESLGGLKLVSITADEYAALSPDSSTVYYVTDDNGGVKHYFGSVELCKGNGGIADAVVSAVGLSGTAVTATSE